MEEEDCAGCRLRSLGLTALSVLMHSSSAISMPQLAWIADSLLHVARSPLCVIPVHASHTTTLALSHSI